LLFFTRTNRSQFRFTCCTVEQDLFQYKALYVTGCAKPYRMRTSIICDVKESSNRHFR